MTPVQFMQRERRKFWQELMEAALFTILWLTVAIFLSMIGLAIKAGVGL